MTFVVFSIDLFFKPLSDENVENVIFILYKTVKFKL